MTMPSAARPDDARRRTAVLVASLLFMTIGTGSIYFVVVALKPMAAEFCWPRQVPSLAYSLQYFGGGVGGILMGWWADRSGMGWPALLGASMIGGGALLTAEIAGRWELFAIYGVMMGLFGRATLFSPLMANITRWFEHKRSMAAGIVGSGQALAGAVWPPVFQHLFEAVGWRQTATLYGLFVLATMLPLVLILRQRPPLPEPVAAGAAASFHGPMFDPAVR